MYRPSRAALRTGLTVLSAALCLATVVLWVRANFVCDEWSRSTVEHDAASVRRYRTRVVALGGTLVLAVEAQTFPARWQQLLGWGDDYGPPTAEDLARDAALRRDLPPGTYIWTSPINGTMQGCVVSHRDVGIPWWLLTLIFAIGPARVLWRRRAARRRAWAAGRCSQCGYDLRATPDRCPECGTVPPPPSSANG